MGEVDGVLVGHHARATRGWRTGTTVVVVPAGATGGVDVRGGGPGTRETDLLRPENLVHQVQAICLSGGSAFGLAAADGVMAHLEQAGIGFPVGDAGQVVPIVPAAVIFDLGRGGVVGNRPDASFGRLAAARARHGASPEGTVGAGTGAVAGGLQGGVGTASCWLDDGTVVGALAVVNAAGSLVDPATALPWHPPGLPLRRPDRDDRRRLADHLAAVAAATAARATNTTIGVVATSARLSKAECTKVAAVAHDGLARAVRPAHSMFDGDTVFALATGQGELVEPAGDERYRSPRGRAAALNPLLAAAADCFAEACARAVVLATSHRGGPPAYRDLCPSAFAAPPGRPVG